MFPNSPLFSLRNISLFLTTVLLFVMPQRTLYFLLVVDLFDMLSIWIQASSLLLDIKLGSALFTTTSTHYLQYLSLFEASFD